MFLVVFTFAWMVLLRQRPRDNSEGDACLLGQFDLPVTTESSSPGLHYLGRMVIKSGVCTA